MFAILSVFMQTLFALVIVVALVALGVFGGIEYVTQEMQNSFLMIPKPY